MYLGAKPSSLPYLLVLILRIENTSSVCVCFETFIMGKLPGFALAYLKMTGSCLLNVSLTWFDYGDQPILLIGL